MNDSADQSTSRVGTEAWILRQYIKANELERYEQFKLLVELSSWEILNTFNQSK